MFLSTYHSSDKFVVTAEAERLDNSWIQIRAKELVWSTGCTSWFIDTKTSRNTQMYPDWQYKFWFRSLWIVWRDFVFSSSEALALEEKKRKSPLTRRSYYIPCLFCSEHCYSQSHAGSGTDQRGRNQFPWQSQAARKVSG